MENAIKRTLPIILLVIVSLLYTRPYFRPGFFPTHDGEWAVVRLAEMQREIKDRQFPPRWADYLNHGYGYPLFSFTYPFPFYVGSVLKVLHIGLVDSVKVIFLGSVVLSAFFMFLLGRELGGNYAGFISGIFYVIAPFRLVDLYVRGSIGESVSLAIFPLLCFLSYKYITKPSFAKLVLCSGTLAVLILSHNIMALIFFPFWVVFCYIIILSYFEDIKLYTWRYIFPMIILGLGLSSFFFLPALIEKKYIILSKISLANISENFILLKDYILSPWNYGAKPSYQLGWAHVLSAVIGCIGLIFSNELQRKKYVRFTLFIFGSIFVLIFLAHPVSTVLWRMPPLSWVDFPWRFLTPIAFFLALSTMLLTIHKITRIVGILLAVLTVIISLKYATPIEYTNRSDSYYETNDATTTSMDELMPIWVVNKPSNRYIQKVVTENGNAKISDLVFNSKMITFAVNSQVPSTLKINTLYFPGWQIQVDKKSVPIQYDNPDGVMKLAVDPGSHSVIARFTDTPVRFWSTIITLGSIGLSVLLIFFSLFSGRFS